MAKRHITIPVDDEQAELLAQTAAEQGQSLAAFVRGRIFARESLQREFQALQSTLLATVADAQRGSTIAPKQTARNDSGNSSTDPATMGLLVEILLHLRGLSNPTKIRTVAAEVRRLGYQPFGGP